MAPRSEAQLNEIREEKRQKILDAALKLFAYSGFEGTTISKIAKKAEVSKGLVYNYFSSKEDVLKAILKMGEQESDTIINEMRSDSPRENIRIMFETLFREVKNHEEFWKLTVALSLRSEEFPYVREMVSNRLEQYIDFIEDLFDKAGIENPKAEARIIGGTLDGIILHYVLANGNYPIDEVKTSLINRYAKPSRTPKT
jgi:AcrR family transcriptional regulator